MCKINEEKMDNVLLELGHDDYNRGTKYLRAAVRLYEGQPLTKEIYPAIAKQYGSTAARVERCIRHSIEKAWNRGDSGAQLRYFGHSVDPSTGKPRAGEYIARMARMCREAEGQESAAYANRVLD